MKCIQRLSLTVLASAALVGPVRAGEELDVEVGRTAGGALAFPPFDFGKATLDAVDPGNPFGLNGYSGENPGWAAEGAPEGLLALEDGADIWVEVLALSPALRMLDPNAGLADIVPGGSWRLGGPEFDAHPLWLIDADHPAFDPGQEHWTAAFRLVDHGTTAYAPSQTHAFVFRIPEPGTGLLFAAAAAVVALRRRAGSAGTRPLTSVLRAPRRGRPPAIPIRGGTPMKVRFPLCTGATAAIAAFSTIAAAQPHGGDLWPCVSSAGVLKLSPRGFSPEDDVAVLPPASGLFQGWSGNSPGFDDIEADDPETDSYPFAPGGTIRLEILALDPALRVWGAGLQQFVPGSTPLLGDTSGDVHTHLIWHIDSQHAQFNGQQTLWRGTFRLIDTGGTNYTPSLPFTLRFRNVACTAGDANADAVVNNFDIDLFVAVLTDPSGATAEQRCAADANLDGLVNNFDIDAFVALLSG
ncbi:MAG: PEP-CTERM sorting domain-containing protein [Phycisphaerae bacterium]